MVLLSLFFQLILIPMGYNRKHSSNHYLRWLLWLSYLCADSVAPISLGMLSNGGGSSSLEPRFIIRAIWAQFFLFHLGGPDTITAYSLQDNDMWLGHFLGLLIQSTLSFYIFLQALQPTAMNFVAILVFVAGIIKYGERTWALRSASSQHLKDQDIPFRIIPLNSIHDFKFPISINHHHHHNNDLHILHIARCFFERNKWVFQDLILSYNDLKQSVCYFVDFDFQTAFKVVDLELGFLHNSLYTKASPIFNSPCFFGARLITSFSILAAIVAFIMINKHRYPLQDVYYTYILLFGEGVEIYSDFLLLCSDWCVIWLTQFDNFLAWLILKAIYASGWSLEMKTWSNSVPQYNLITTCFEEINIYRHCKSLISNPFNIEKNISRPISNELKKRIFEQLNKMVEIKSCEEADWLVGKRRLYDHIGWNMELDSVQSILLWHIATEICYYRDYKNKALKNSISLFEDTKLLSNYLTYLLAYRQSLFSNGMGQTRFEATVVDAKDILRRHFSRFLRIIEDAYEYVMEELELRVGHGRDVKELGVESLLNHGFLLAKELQRVEENERWEIISHEWVELFARVACECKFYDHLEQLGHGGDLLTHVWLLMHHIGYKKHAYDATNPRLDEQIREFRRVLKRRSGGGSCGVFITQP